MNCLNFTLDLHNYLSKAVNTLGARTKLANRMTLTGLKNSFRIPAAALNFLMTKTHFVICPSENGMDSHRIWESAYSGAVPVILKEHAPGGSQNWPTLAVESWGDLKEISDDNWSIRKKQILNSSTILHLEQQIWSHFSFFEDAQLHE